MEETERKTVMDRLRGPPVLNAGNKQQTDPVGFSDRISHKKGMTMNLKNKKGKRLTSTLMAVLMSVSTTLTPVNTMASEPEISSAAVESTLEETTAEPQVQTVSETSVSKTQEQAASETAASEAQTSASEMQPVPETTEEAVCTEEVQTSGESAEETSANETRGPDETQENETTAESESETEEVTETETVEETSSEEPTIDLSNATREDILSYIEAIGGDESDAFYTFIGSLGEYDYQLVWMAQYGAQEDQLLENFGFDYDAASDLDVAKYIHKLSEEELADFVESMTFEQYRRYISIKEMMAEMDEKDFSDIIDDEEFTADRTWDCASYDAFAESLTGVSLQRTEQTMQFYNTYVDPSKVQAGVTTIDGLLDSNADWYSNDYILGLNPEMFKETVPVYHGADGNYYVVSTVPTLNGVESADYQPATSFYNGSVEAQAFTDIEYLGNGVYRIPSSRYQYCFTEQYVSDMGTLYGISFGLRIQVLYGFTPSGEITIAADVVYPDMTERFLPAKLNLLAGIATVRVFNDDYDDSVDNYLVSASINRGASLPDSVGSMNDGKVLQFVVNDANAVGSLDVLIGYNATSKYSMAAEVTTAELIGSASDDVNVNMAAEMYNGAYLKLDQGSVPNNLAVGDKFIYANTALTITGVETSYDLSNTTQHPDRGIHVGAKTIPTHDAQSFCFYNGKGADTDISSWFKTQLNTNSADPGYMVQMTVENMQSRAAWNGTSTNLRQSQFPTIYTPKNHIFGYMTDGLGAMTDTSGKKTLNLEGTNVLLSCMHAWGNESETTPQDIVDSISTFTGRTQRDFAIDEGSGHYHPNIALQCTDVHDGGDGNTYATFKVLTSMLQVGGVKYAHNYQCAFATISIVYPSAPQTGFLQIHKSSADPAITNGNSCYNFEGIPYGIFTDAECRNPVTVVTLDANGYSQPYELTAGTYYVREAEAKPGSGYQTNSTVYTIEVTAGTTATAPVMCETTDVPLNDPFGIVINKINADGTTTADLSGAEYTIKYYPKQYNTVAEIQADPEAKATTWVIKTIKDASGNYQAFLDDAHIVSGVSDGAKFGKNTMGTYIIPLGTLTVEETKAPTGFTKDGAVVSSAATGATLTGTNNVYLFNLVDKDSAIYLKSGNALDTAATDETAITLQYAERQINGTPKMEKHDLELNKKAAMGGTNFAGITFEVYCLDDSVIIGNTTYKKGETIETVTSDAEGNVTMTTQYPIGHYAVREKSANNYYTNDGQIHYFNVVEYQGGAFIQYETNMNAVTFTDRVVRGDLSFVKKNADTEETLAYIPFRITNNTTGETHYILTSADGTFTSAVGKTTNTNANDAVLSQYGDKDVIPQSVVDSLAKDAGLWFGMGSEGTMTAANDSYGSFVYGTYTITELKTEATRNMKMYTSTFTIDTDGKVLDLGTVNNVPMGIKTTLVDVNEEHFTEPVSSITLTDHVAYKNLDTDKTYTLTGTLYVKEGDALTELMTETVDFTPAEKNGIQDVTFTFDASALKGKSVVAFEELSVNGEFCAEHKDKDDENQTVTFPDIQTTARDNVTEDHVSNAADSVTIIDTVTYTGLKAGETYEITGTLMDAETGEAALDDDGNAITASKEFTAPTADGNIDITFTFAGVSLAGKTLVAFEDISYEGRRYAVHADINDKNQTVYIPKIHTKALDANTGLNQVLADSNATVVDTVTYTHLLPGKTYVMKGVLMTSAGNALMVNGKTITASTEFVPTTPDGTVDVTFNFDASEIGGRKLVFYEYLELDGNTVASHTDISDTDQTVYVPKLRTTIFDSENGSHNSAADEDIILIDTVRYNGVEIGRKYTVVGTLVDKETGNALLDDAGNKITASNEFVAEKTNGTIDVTFKFSGKCLAGKTTVAFEDMYSEGKKVAVHADLRDEGQTEYFPSVHTTATSNDTEDHVVGANEKVTITDQVALKALKLGTEYTLSGTLMNAKTGKPIMVNGNTITARRTFTADAHEMTIPLTYTLNASELAGTTTVVFENLYSDGALLAAHADLEDEEQTVYIPEIHTTAKDQTTKINHTEANKTATIVDTVSYTNLLPGREYTVSGTLMDKETGKTVLADGKEITASTTFTPEKSEGSVDVIFTFDASIVAPKTVVAFETLTYKKIQIAVHADIEDKDQTVYIPTIRTSAKDNVTGINHTEADKEVTITDTVTYKGLEVGREYTVSGTLMNQRTGAKILVNGKPVTASTTFTAEEKEGSVEVVFTFDATALEGTTTVVFETLYTENKEVAAHTDINDKGQTIYIPKIRTTAISDDTNDHVTKADEKITLIDTVAFTSLEVGREYTVTGKLMDRAANKPILVDGKEVTAQTTFVPETTDGTVDVTFTFDGTGLEDTVIVVFETLYTEKKEVAVHADITDEEQSVYVPEIHTKAEDATTEINHTEALPKAKIVDTVSYSSLLPGKEYTMTGTLMNKKTGEPILIDGNPVTSQVAFMAEKPEGSVKIVFLFDASVLAGTTVVAFESLTYKGVEVAVHADIEDKDQTVYIPEIHTTAVGEDTKDHVTEAKKDVTIVDTVSFKSLEVGREYTVKGVLMDKSAEKTLLVNGEEVTAETTFVPETTDGTVDVTFTFDGTGLEDTLLVAFETLYTEEKEVGVHAEIEDDAQTVYLPKIQTEAKDAVTEIDHTEALPKAKIIDTVSYSSLLPGKEYTVTGTLMNKETKEPVLIDGEKVTASTTFTAEKSEGSVEVVFEFDASAIAGTTVVAFESMEYEGVEVAVHADIEDEDQTVYIPDVHTTATAANTTHDHVTGANEDLIITDEVVLTGLKIGNEYTVKGVLMDKSTGEELKVNDESITAEETFTADAADMIITLTYTLDAITLAGTTTVVFETLYTEGKEVGRHHEIDDEGQTVYIPEIHTTAKDQTTKINHTEANDKATIVDTVYYSHLLPGKEYTVHGKLMDKKTGEPILIDDKEITASTTFTAEKSEGSVDVIFTFDASILAPKTVVAFEYMEYEGIEIAVHADIDDEDQTVYIPKIHTTAVGEDTQDHIEKAKEEAVIVDTVSYEGLEIGREYTVAGKLMDKETGEPILVNGEEVTASETFTAETEEGGIDITFTFDSSALAGKSLVAFETLYTEEKEVAVHADITDEGQTVRIPEIHTTATDKVTGDHDGVVAKETTVLDEVFYTNLIPGKEYTVSGKLMVKETGEPLTIDGKEVTAEKTFVAEEADGSIILEFTFDSSALAGKKIVAFEDVTYEGISIGTHEDLTDEDQTISYPEIHTTAADQASGSKTMTLGSSVTLVDTVTYKGLTAGKTYVVKGTIMDKASGETIGVTAETTFTAEAADGSVEVTFTFDTTQLQGKTLVVFETLYDTQGNPIVAHSDLNDEDQTVSVPVQPVIPPVVTGDDSSPMPYVFGLAVAVLIAMAAVVILLRKRKNQK
ncbi:MAG: VaFE repeat-containing surface-anchored protein [Lachnospiraceae bacterium]